MISLNRIKYARAKLATVALLCSFLYVHNVSASNIFLSPTDTLKLKKDSGSIVSFKNSQVAYSSFINPRNNIGQELPEFVQRLELYPVISVGGIKFSSSFFLSTEDFSQGRNVNRINISFDKSSFTNFKRKVTTEDNISKKIDSVNNAIEDQKRN